MCRIWGGGDDSQIGIALLTRLDHFQDSQQVHLIDGSHGCFRPETMLPALTASSIGCLTGQLEEMHARHVHLILLQQFQGTREMADHLE